MPILACVIAIIISAGTLALSVHLITAPEFEAQHAAAPSNVRQIPLGKTPDVSRGDPHNQLTPIYPASPGQDLPPPADVADNATTNDTPVEKPAADIAPAAETTGVAANADADDREAASPAPSPSPAVMPAAATTATAPNSCAIAACSSAYRSFRESDCTYQPYEGPRRTCDLGDNAAAQNASADSAPAVSRDRIAVSRSRMRSQIDELDEVERVVRRLPGPYYDDERIVIIEEPRRGYGRMGYGRPGVIYRED